MRKKITRSFSGCGQVLQLHYCIASHMPGGLGGSFSSTIDYSCFYAKSDAEKKKKKNKKELFSLLE